MVDGSSGGGDGSCYKSHDDVNSFKMTVSPSRPTSVCVTVDSRSNVFQGTC